MPLIPEVATDSCGSGVDPTGMAPLGDTLLIVQTVKI